MIDVAIIIVTYNTKDLTLRCLGSIYQNLPKVSFKVTVVDNASSDRTTQAIKKQFPQVKIINSEYNSGFARGNNLALQSIQSKYYLLLNSDTEVLPDSIDQLVSFMEKNDFGIGSCDLLDKNGDFQPNAGDLPTFWPVFFWLTGLDDLLFFFKGKLPSYHRQDLSYYNKDKTVGWVSGSVMIIKNEVIKKVGLFDQGIFMYGEDVDYCLRTKSAGFKIGWTNQAKIKHLGGGSSKDPDYKQWLGEFKGLLYLYRKNYGFLKEQFLKIFIYLFVLIRAGVFLLFGRIKVSQTYAKIIVSL